jgi:hypothetical protein
VEIGLFVAGVVCGALVSWLISRHYYRRSGENLDYAREEIVGKVLLILRALEESGDAVLAQDASGRITGLQFTKPVGADGVFGSDSATSSVNPPGSARGVWTAPTEDETPPPKIP